MKLASMPIIVPSSLDEWTYDLIKDLVDRPITETELFDFKFNLPDADTLTDVCCSFANTKGGFIILGVRQNSSFTIEGIDYDREISHNFGNKLRAQPTINYDSPKFIKIPDSQKFLVIFHIPLSDSRPHTHSDLHKMKFWKRTNKGKQLMTLEELREEFHRPLRRVELSPIGQSVSISNYEELDVSKLDSIISEYSKSGIKTKKHIFDKEFLPSILSIPTGKSGWTEQVRNIIQKVIALAIHEIESSVLVKEWIGALHIVIGLWDQQTKDMYAAKIESIIKELYQKSVDSTLVLIMQEMHNYDIGIMSKLIDDSLKWDAETFTNLKTYFRFNDFCRAHVESVKSLKDNILSKLRHSEEEGNEVKFERLQTLEDLLNAYS